MAISISIPRTTGDTLVVNVDPGKAVFFVGANGSGKSSLVYQLSRSSDANVKRISAHRQNWLASSSSNLSAQQRQQQDQNIRNSEQQIHSRWKEDYAGYKPNISIFDLVDAENVRARSIAKAMDSGDTDAAVELAKKVAPLNLINEILRDSNFSVSIEIRDNGELYARNQSGAEYGIAEMSDGERNALLIAADVLTADAGSLLIIDEPERHLHHSIVDPLLKSLFRLKSDCSFAISTHSVGLLDRDLGAMRLLVRSCEFQGQQAISWDIDQLSDDDDIDDDIRTAILGSRRKILFVEGDRSSLDLQLYSILFPMVSVVPVGSCAEVERSVKGIRNTASLHWAKAFGIIDRDGRPDSEVATLKTLGIFALPVHSVESLYYNFAVQDSIAIESQKLRGDDPEQLLNASKTALIAAVSQHVERLAAQVTTRRIRRDIEHSRPTLRDVIDNEPISINFDVASMRQEDEVKLNALIDSESYNEIVGNYPIRETGAIGAMSRALGFQTELQYQRTVRVYIRNNPTSLGFLRGLFDGLFEELE